MPLSLRLRSPEGRHYWGLHLACAVISPAKAELRYSSSTEQDGDCSSALDHTRRINGTSSEGNGQVQGKRRRMLNLDDAALDLQRIRKRLPPTGSYDDMPADRMRIAKRRRDTVEAYAMSHTHESLYRITHSAVVVADDAPT